MAYFYGPVPSRRLGFSLGLDLTPKKVCTFDCIYCQVGPTTRKTSRRIRYVDLDRLAKELKVILKKNLRIDCITLSGSGEPTLHKDLDTIIVLIKRVSRGKIPVCVITNSSLLYRADVRRELHAVDILMPSLDSVTPRLFHAINKPLLRRKGECGRVVESLIKLRKEFSGQIWLEVMVIKGINDSLSEARKLKAAIEAIKPDKVLLNTPERPCQGSVSSPSKERLQAIKRILGAKAEIVASFFSSKQRRPRRDVVQAILEYVRRRPARAKDLAHSLGIKPRELSASIAALLGEAKIKRSSRKGGYLTINDPRRHESNT